MRDILDALPSIAASMSTVLICGEAGTGKMHLARTIHNMGALRDKPFVPIVCHAMPRSFTGWKENGELPARLRTILSHSFKSRPGTYFLDEVGESPPAFQQVILGIMQALSPRKKENLADCVRVIASTSHDLQALARDGRFREDLYYHLNVMKLELLPLRLRKAEIVPVVEGLVARFNREHDKAIRSIEPEAMAMIMAYDWPGNIAELESVIEHCFTVCCGSVIYTEHLPDDLWLTDLCTDLDFLPPEERITYHAIASTLKRYAGDYNAAAIEMGIPRLALERKIRKWGINE